MGLYASDGLPQSYYDTLFNKSAMAELHDTVVSAAHEYPEADAQEICSMIKIDLIWIDHVEQILADFRCGS